MMLRHFAAAVVVLVFACATAAAQGPTFTFTAIPDQDETRLYERFNKVADYLEQKLGVRVTYVPVKSYDAAVTAFRNNQVQLAWFGGLSGVQARKLVPGSKAIAQGVEDVAFKTYFIAHHSTGLKKSDSLPEAIRGMTMTFGSKGSTSGRLMPEYYVRQRFNAAPETVFSRVGFSGDHSRTIAEVQSGAFQLGVLNYQVWEQEVKEGIVDPAKVKVIWETPTYPDYQWTIRGDVDATYGSGFTQKVTDAFLQMKNEELLASFPRKGFIKADDEDYKPIEDTAKAIGLLDQ
jgi:phosphonate transport system substrate-binding protein